MAHAARRFPPLTLNTDGRSHPKENGLAVFTFVIGLVAVVSSIWPGMHLLSCWAGLVALGTGAYSQMISATRGERFLNIIGLGAAAVGFGIGLAHGGPFGGVIGG